MLLLLNRGIDDYSYYNWPAPHAADKLAAEELQPFMFEGVSIIHMTGISLMIEPRRSAILKAVEMAKERGIIVSFDACFPTDKEDAMAPAGRKVMKSSDVLKVNLHELSYWYHNLQNETAEDFGVGGFIFFADCDTNTKAHEDPLSASGLLITFLPAGAMASSLSVGKQASNETMMPLSLAICDCFQCARLNHQRDACHMNDRDTFEREQLKLFAAVILCVWRRPVVRFFRLHSARLKVASSPAD